MSPESKTIANRTFASPSSRKNTPALAAGASVGTTWQLASVALQDAYTDFVLSRQAMRCTQNTLTFYGYTAGKFLTWLEGQNVTTPAEVDARHVRAFLAELIASGKSDWTVNDNARAIRTLLRFWHAEGYLPAPVTFAMPKVEKKRLPCLTAEQVQTVLAACNNPRDKAVILLMVDTGLRRSEVIGLNWGDMDIATGLARVTRGKGGKARSVVIGVTTRRALLAYRRTFVILSLRAGMDVLHLQALLGHSSLEIVQHYAQMVDDDLLESHRMHSPIDNLARLAKK